MLRKLLICGLLAGLCGGSAAAVFARLAGEPSVNRAIAFERAEASAAGTPDEAPVVSRALQESAGLLTASIVYGVALGGLLALVFAVAYGRAVRAGPASTGVMLAAGAFVVLYLVPFVKYPPNPPSVGDPDTITRRTAVYGIMILISLLAALAAVRLRGALAVRGPRAATLAAVGLYLALVLVAGLLLPTVDEVPRAFPATTLFRFREASLGMQAVLWTTIGLVFAATAERVMTGRAMLPRRRRSLSQSLPEG
jgi:predicted cobalt transporter CbtA